MKKIFSFLLLAAISLNFTTAFKQSKDPSTWTFEAKKKADNSYDIIITATMAKPWHIYSQSSPEADGTPIPTKVTFTANPLISKNGKVVESGKLVKEFDKYTKANLAYYYEKVVFTQNVKVKGKAKTTVAGNVSYMMCDDEKCLPPTTKNFSVKLP